MNKNKFKKTKILISFLLIYTSCGDYLDIIPDNVPTIDHAFNKRYQAEGYLYGCYSFLPNFAQIAGRSNPGFLAGDEVWIFNDANDQIDKNMWYIAKGEQGTDSPLGNYWGSHQDSYNLNSGKPLFTGISDCNIFLDNIHKLLDIEDWERKQWIAEVKCLKAYFHFWLLRMYGPIPILDKNLPISATSEQVQVYREPVDQVVDYIVELLDEAIINLPLQIQNFTENAGRFTKPIAYSIKAQVLTLAASPLFNGNWDYNGFVDNRGVYLFSQEYDPLKWERATKALKEAIDIAHEAGHKLFDFSTTNISVSMETALAMQVRGAVTERWNEEIIWGALGPAYLQRISLPAIDEKHLYGDLQFLNAPTLNVVKQFYTRNGIPIEEDKEWENIDLFEIVKGDANSKMYIGEGYETIQLHFNREPRFYGAITFDGGTFYGFGNISDKSMETIKLRYNSIGPFRANEHSSTGYLVKKVVSRLTGLSKTSSIPTFFLYPFPVIRLADLYLMYSEALNETKETPDAGVYEYIDLVRERTGLKGVVESWQNYSNQPDKPYSKNGMREIIQRERLNELAFEGIRFWDLRRWKLSEKYMNEPIQGLNILGSTPEDFYTVNDLFLPTFISKDYLWPLRTGNLLKNKNLVQNPGW